MSAAEHNDHTPPTTPFGHQTTIIIEDSTEPQKKKTARPDKYRKTRRIVIVGLATALTCTAAYFTITATKTRTDNPTFTNSTKITAPHPKTDSKLISHKNNNHAIITPQNPSKPPQDTKTISAALTEKPQAPFTAPVYIDPTIPGLAQKPASPLQIMNNHEITGFVAPKTPEPTTNTPLRVNKRIVLIPAPGVAVYRIPKPTPTTKTPTTNSLTIYHKWAVACESRDSYKSCFASAYVSANDTVMKLKLGLAATMSKTGNQSILRTAAGKPLYVLTITGPEGFDENTGFTITGNNAFANIPLTDQCTKTKCVGSAYINPEYGTLTTKGPAKHKTISITGTVGDESYIWRFNGRGLNEAFNRVIEEMKSP